MRQSTAPLYAGGFLGPFGGAMIVALIPSIAAGLDTSVGLVAGAITAYMIPFATLQLFSGTIAERVGAARVVRTAYVAFGIAAILCTIAPNIGVFITGRALMGASNAFLTPVLLAALSEAVPKAVLGRSVGTFAAVQVAGLSLAPVIGGALGEVSWRLAFGLVAVVAFALALRRVDVRARPKDDRASLRDLVSRWIGLLAATAMAGYLGFTAIGFVVALVAAQEYGLGSAASGLIVASYGAGGILFGRYAGTVADRAGRPATALAGTVACGAGVLGMAFAPSAWSIAVIFFLVGCASAFVWAGLNTIAVEAFPENRAGAVSAYSAFKFVGVAIAPLLYVPIFENDMRTPFLVATAFSAVTAVLIVPWFARYRSGTYAETPSAGLADP